MRKSFFSIIFFIFYSCLLLAENQNNLINLTKIFYQEGQLSDQITLFFNKKISSIYDPEAKVNNFSKSVSFFLPFVTINNASKKVIDVLKRSKRIGYKIIITEVRKPLIGVKIYIEYNPGLIDWEYNKCDGLESKLIFKFYNKNIVDLINKKSSPLRWYAYANHLPKIVLDNNLYLVKSETITNIKKNLEKFGFEVCLIRNSSQNINHDMAAGFSNIICCPDAYIYVANIVNNDRQINFNSTVNDKIEFLDSTTKLTLNNINDKLIMQNKKLSDNIQDKLKIKVNNFLLGFEMPSVSISFDKKINNNFVQTLVANLAKYFGEQRTGYTINSGSRIKFSIN